MSSEYPFEVLWDAPEALHEILIAELGDIGFDTFWESPEGLRAYSSEAPKVELLESLIQQYASQDRPISYRVQSTHSKLWEPAQEGTFGNFCLLDTLYVCSPEDVLPQQYPIELKIKGALAFGDGRHPSTRLMLEAMLAFPFKQKKVLDIGTGTGILALVAEKMGAHRVDALDNNPWALEISRGNLHLNQSSRITLYPGYTHEVSLSPPYDCILANLNFEALAQELGYFSTLLQAGGHLFLGGFQQKDQNPIRQMIGSHSMEFVQESQTGLWLNWLVQRHA